jgi:hypothetical protein
MFAPGYDRGNVSQCTAQQKYAGICSHKTANRGCFLRRSKTRSSTPSGVFSTLGQREFKDFIEVLETDRVRGIGGIENFKISGVGHTASLRGAD